MVNYKIKTGMVGGEYFIIAIVDNKKILHPMRLGIERFFEKWADRENKILQLQKCDIQEGDDDK